jgi:hypothetical protein
VIKPGTRVRLRLDIQHTTRPHLDAHARHADVGVVLEPGSTPRVLMGLYVVVRFDVCRQNHRLLPEEIEPAE